MVFGRKVSSSFKVSLHPLDGCWSGTGLKPDLPSSVQLSSDPTLLQCEEMAVFKVTLSDNSSEALESNDQQSFTEFEENVISLVQQVRCGPSRSNPEPDKVTPSPSRCLRAFRSQLAKRTLHESVAKSKETEKSNSMWGPNLVQLTEPRWTKNIDFRSLNAAMTFDDSQCPQPRSCRQLVCDIFS